jgi:hypothetical protein
MNEWNIQSRARSCHRCGQPFVDKQPFHTLLFEEKGVLIRIDVCDDCCKEHYAPAADRGAHYISYWQGVFEPPPPPSAEPIQKATAETLLRSLIESQEPKYGPACYILAVMLERKRVLKVKEQFVRDGRRTFIYEHPKSGDVFSIGDPDLQLNQLEEVQRMVASLLEHGFPQETSRGPDRVVTEAPVEPVAKNESEISKE